MKLLNQSAKTNWKFIAIVLLALALVGFLLWSFAVKNFQFYDYHSPAEQNWEYPQEQPTIDNEQSAIGTSDWQTYRNDEFGFGLSYPRDWNLVSVGKKENIDERFLFQAGSGAMSIVYLASQPFSIKDLENLESDPLLLPEIIIAVDNNYAWAAESAVMDPYYFKTWEEFNLGVLGKEIVPVDPTYSYPTEVVVFNKKKNVFIVISTKEDINRETLSRQILSTFRFAE